MNKVIMPANEQKYAPQNGEEEGKKNLKRTRKINMRTKRAEVNPLNGK